MRCIVTGGAGLARTLQTQSQLAPPVLQLCSCGTSQAALQVLKLPPCGRSLLAQHHDAVIIDNLATGPAG